MVVLKRKRKLQVTKQKMLLLRMRCLLILLLVDPLRARVTQVKVFHHKLSIQTLKTRTSSLRRNLLVQEETRRKRITPMTSI